MNTDNPIIDFHAHILPGADHGSESLEESAKQLRYLWKTGAQKVVATPHFYPQRHSVSCFIEKRESAAALLSNAQIGERPEVYLGAEVLLCPGIDRMEDISKLCIKGTNVLFLEMPFSKWGEEHYETVYRLSKSGLRVVMAHVDRYPDKDVERLLSECTVMCQLNAETVKTFRGRKRAENILSSYNVAAIGSDLHGADKSAVHALWSLSERLGDYGKEIFQRSNALLEGAVKL